MNAMLRLINTEQKLCYEQPHYLYLLFALLIGLIDVNKKLK
jgi:hypothetical protein